MISAWRPQPRGVPWRVELAQKLINRAIVHHEAGRYEQSIRFVAQARSLLREHTDDYTEAESDGRVTFCERAKLLERLNDGTEPTFSAERDLREVGT